jgi:hypothetical protein
MKRQRGRAPGSCFWVALVALGLASCGPTNSGGASGGGGDGDGGRGKSDGSSSNYGDGGGGGGGGGDAGDPDNTKDSGPCAADTVKAQQLPLDMYIMLDQSPSMAEAVSGGQTKWQAVTTALASFLNQSGLTGFSVGLQYFPLNNDSCNAADYATPAVAIASLPGVATAIGQSLASASHGPGNGGDLTPTSAALQGAENYARAWAQAHTDHVTIVVFATDGQPTECDQTPANIYNIAKTAATGMPKVLTFVIGVLGAVDDPAVLNGIAQNGGTTQPFIVNTTSNVAQQFLAALNAIRGAALGCTYKIPSPDGGTPDYHKVNVQYTPGSGGSPQLIPQVTDQAHCPASGDAWYYDNPSAPTQILLCDSTCNKVKADSTGEVDVLLGCTTILD